MNTPSGFGPDGVERSEWFSFPTMNPNDNLISLTDTLGSLVDQLLTLVTASIYSPTTTKVIK